MKKSNFKKYSKFYDLLYSDKNYAEEAHYIFNEIKSLNQTCKFVLDLGCGTGTHAKILQKKGINIEGVELSKEMAEIARSNNVRCTIADISKFELNKKFDIILSLFHVMSYVTDLENLLKTFKNVNKHLNTNGYFIFDVWYTPAVYSIKPEIKIKHIENKSISITRISTPQIDYINNTVDVNFQMFCKDFKNSKIFEIKEVHSMKHFTVLEIELISKLCGFKIIKIEESFTKKIPSNQTWSVMFYLQKVV